ncbi:hypothetical protein M405DRAFT_861719 [Rhizopogon salebrosus TDB-379]|nr:hypothetical protein M405DRAFT_861719 [Rhizopogon salebrosus TDB-379]
MKLHSSVTTSAVPILLQRLKAYFPTTRGSLGHRHIVSAFMLAPKAICDDAYSNKYIGSTVAQGMFQLREINQMEREMFQTSSLIRESIQPSSHHYTSFTRTPPVPSTYALHRTMLHSRLRAHTQSHPPARANDYSNKNTPTYQPPSPYCPNLVQCEDNKGATPPALKLEGVREEIELDKPGVPSSK